ncbi:MAG: ABC transporter permease [Gammaproteobacteria bacterium]|nr:ABC transporter permease [Gammaproteobacteria bacterium]MDH5652564.1 ABC transporter permease [Gammaproteobacteria bacterium]
MYKWLWQTLWQQKTGVLSGAGSVAVALVLVVIMDASFVGESRQTIAYIEKMRADVWVMQHGVSNMHMASSYVWDWKLTKVRQVAGVKRATPILYMNSVFAAGKRNWFSYVIGLPEDGQRAGPWAVSSGKAFPARGEILLPQVLEKAAGIKLGDMTRIGDHSFRIVGFTRDTFSMSNSIAFVSFDDLQDLIAVSGSLSYILVDAEEGVDAKALATRIESEVDKVTAITHEQFLANDYQIGLLMGAEVLSIMTLIGIILAVLIAVFTAYLQVDRCRRELAILKTVGFPNRTLYGMMLLQSMIISLLALIFTLVSVFILTPLLTALVPMINLVLTEAILLRVSYIALLVSLLAVIPPAWMVARVDPLTAFKV